MTKIKLLIATLLCFPPVGWAGNFSASAKGTTAANFLNMGVGARAVAMGGAYTCAANQADAIAWNPAALRNVEHNSLSFMHAAYLESSNYDFGGYARSGETSSIGVGVQYMSVGSVTGRDPDGFETSNFEPNDLAVSLGYARSLGGFALGLTGKYIQEKIVTSAQTGAVDLGLLTPRYLNDKVRFGVAVTNLGGTLTFDEKAESLPLKIQAGSLFQITPKWLATFDAGFPKSNNPFVAAGTEYVLSVGKESSLAGRAGYSSQTEGQLNGFSGVSLGAGFVFKKFSLDYGFVPFGDLGDTHRVSVSFDF